MKNILTSFFAFVLVFAIASICLTGCKKTTPPKDVNTALTDQEELNKSIADLGSTEQTTCPVMEGKINKDIFTEYKGKKVYFCCQGCVEAFNKNPEKYIDKLPQFIE